MSFDVTNEGDPLDALSVDGRLSDVATAYNDLTAAGIRRKSLGDRHLPALTDPTTLFTKYSGGSDEALLANERYDNTLPVAGGGVHNYLQLFAPSGPYGSYTRPAAGIAEEGWLIPQTSGAAEAMEVQLNRSTELGNRATSDGVDAVLATAWIAVESLLDVADDPGTDPNADPNAIVDAFFNCVYLGIGVEDSSGARKIINRSIRRVTASGARRGPISTATLITAADLTAPLDGRLEKVFGAVVSGVAAADAASQHAPLDLTLRRFRIDVEPVRGGVLD